MEDVNVEQRSGRFKEGDGQVEMKGSQWAPREKG